MSTFPANSESHMYSKYQIVVFKKSAYVPNEMVEDPTQEKLACPRCGRHNPPIEHGHHRSCEHCKLNMERWGNSLEIWG